MLLCAEPTDLHSISKLLSGQLPLPHIFFQIGPAHCRQNAICGGRKTPSRSTVASTICGRFLLTILRWKRSFLPATSATNLVFPPSCFPSGKPARRSTTAISDCRLCSTRIWCCEVCFAQGSSVSLCKNVQFVSQRHCCFPDQALSLIRAWLLHSATVLMIMLHCTTKGEVHVSRRRVAEAPAGRDGGCASRWELSTRDQLLDATRSAAGLRQARNAEQHMAAPPHCGFMSSSSHQADVQRSPMSPAIAAALCDTALTSAGCCNAEATVAAPRKAASLQPKWSIPASLPPSAMISTASAMLSPAQPLVLSAWSTGSHWSWGRIQAWVLHCLDDTAIGPFRLVTLNHPKHSKPHYWPAVCSSGKCSASTHIPPGSSFSHCWRASVSDSSWERKKQKLWQFTSKTQVTLLSFSFTTPSRVLWL